MDKPEYERPAMKCPVLSAPCTVCIGREVHVHREAYGSVVVRSVRESVLDVPLGVECSELTATVERPSSIKCQNCCSRQA